MPHHLRYQSRTWATHHITSRCLQGFSRLKPSYEISAIIRGVFCYSASLFKSVIKIHHVVFMPNHFHLLLSAQDTNDMANFMQHLKSNLALELNRIHDWQGPMWQKAYSNEEILDLAAFEERFKYLSQNTVKEGLINHPKQWPGLHAYHQIVEGKRLQGQWLNRTALNDAKRVARGKRIDERKFTTSHEVELTPPPLWYESTENQYESRYWLRAKSLCEEAILDAQTKRTQPAIGIKRLLSQNIFKPRKIERGKRILCRTTCLERLKAYKKRYYEFKVLYQEASATLRDAIAQGLESIKVSFPPGGIPLPGIKISENPV